MGCETFLHCGFARCACFPRRRWTTAVCTVFSSFVRFKFLITRDQAILQSFITGTEKHILTNSIMTLFPGVALVTGAGSGNLPQQYGFTRRTPLPAQKNICHSCRTELF